jgi:CheY-like chemotaxis protein
MSALSGKRILLVEDEYLIAEDAMRSFQGAGAVVAAASNLSSAMQAILATAKFDGAVLDVNLHSDMVWPLADLLVARGVPFVFATGYNADALPSRFAGHAHCEKPVSPEKVARALFPSSE